MFMYADRRTGDVLTDVKHATNAITGEMYAVYTTAKSTKITPLGLFEDDYLMLKYPTPPVPKEGRLKDYLCKP